MNLMVKNRFDKETISKNISRKNISNKSMILGSYRKKRQTKVRSKKNQGLQHRGGGMWK